MFFEEKVNFRLKRDDLKLIDKIVKKDDVTYDSDSHFIRCAVLKLLREERKRLGLR